MCCSHYLYRRNRRWTPGSICILVVCPCFNIHGSDNIRLSECRRTGDLKHVTAITKPRPTSRVLLSGCTPACLHLPPLPSPSHSLSFSRHFCMFEFFVVTSNPVSFCPSSFSSLFLLMLSSGRKIPTIQRGPPRMLQSDSKFTTLTTELVDEG